MGWSHWSLVKLHTHEISEIYYSFPVIELHRYLTHWNSVNRRCISHDGTNQVRLPTVLHLLGGEQIKRCGNLLRENINTLFGVTNT